MLAVRLPLLLLLAGSVALRHSPPHPPGAAVPRVLPNDNRTAAGTLRAGVLTLRLEARLGEWHPDGERAPGAVVPAFALPGGVPRIPGPLIRVPGGTEVALTVHNALPDTLWLGGLGNRPAPASDTPAPFARPDLILPPGTTRVLRFQLATPGTYYYWGSTMGRAVNLRSGVDSQLSGAIVVDPPGRPAPADRILLIGMWADTVGRALTHRHRLLAVVNGLSWPHTERLHYATGDTARWRVINASGDSHPMHLHGFYFRLDSHGDWRTDTVFGEASRRNAVTEDLMPGTTMSLTWVPERPGNWVFHCHIPEHFAARGSLGLPRSDPAAEPAKAAPHEAMNHALGEMNGLVMGVQVRPGPGYHAAADVPEAERRQLRLVVAPRRAARPDEPRFAYLLEGAPATPGTLAAPPLELVRGQPVSITVVNTLPEPTAVHWHGIELESYYDGVPGFSGAGTRLSPMIAPGDSFVARFTPPRSGTFIYHTHADEERQQVEGLAGALIVLDPGAPRDHERDRDIMISSPRDSAAELRFVLLNGSLAPPPMQLRAGTSYRFRFINMTLRRPGMFVNVSREGAIASWRVLAKDGADLPPASRVTGPARTSLSIGETVDVELAPAAPGSWQLEVRGLAGQLLGSWKIAVTP